MILVPHVRKRVAVLASGRGSNVRALLEAQALGKLPLARIVLVLTNRPSAGALDVAKEFSVESLVVDHKKFTGDRGAHEREIVRLLASRKIDIVVLAGYMRVLSGALLDVYEGRTINIHPSLLPAFPGAHAQRDALAAGAKLSGCTVHFVTSDLDAGPIILQRPVPVEEDDTEESLSARILEQEHIALPEALRLLSEGRLRVDGRRVIKVPPPEDTRAELLIATGNQHKVQEIESILDDVPFRIRSTNEFPGYTDVEENGKTYEDNALLKARTWHRRKSMWTLADDSGIEVDALDGRPGVLSARYAATSDARIARMLDEMSRVKDPAKRTARFVSVVALCGPGGVERIVRGTCEGRIAFEPRGNGGFGYDPIFIPDGFKGKHLAELGDAVKNTISHRARALAAMRAHLIEYVKK